MKLKRIFFWIPAVTGIGLAFASENKIRHIEPYGTSYQIKESLIELPSEDYLENFLFKIVQGEGEHLSEEPQEKTKDTYYLENWEMVPNKSGWFRDQVVRISDHNLDAENVFYYLNMAYAYLKQRFGFRLKGLQHPPLTIRVGMTSQYHMYLKFSDHSQYNNAITISDPATANLEIWFYLPKRIEKDSFWKFSPIHRYLFKNTALLTEVLPFDSAKLADVIFHEYGHVMTKPYLGVSFNTPLREGFSDYLASLVNDTRTLGDIKPFNPDWLLGTAEKYTHDIDELLLHEYQRNFEYDVVLGTQFVSSLLCELEDFLPPYLLDQTLLSILEKLKPQSDIVDLGSAIVLSLYEINFDLGSFYLHDILRERPQLRRVIFERLESTGRGSLIPLIDHAIVSGTVLDMVEDLPLEGVLVDQGNYIGRLGTHRLALKDGRIFYLRGDGLDIYCGEERVRYYKVSGQLKIEEGLWSKKKGIVLQVSQIEAVL